MPTLHRDGEIFQLHLGDTENRFHPDWLAEAFVLLDAVAAADGPRALVTVADGKFFSNGLDVEWLDEHPSELASYLVQIHRLLARVLALPVPTVAAVQGHAFGAGAMFALAHDFAVMRGDRGYFCLPEVDLGMPFSRGMAGLVQDRLPKRTAHEAMTTGRRYGGAEAVAASIVEAIADQDQLVSAATERARPLAGKAGAALGAIKQRMYAGTLAALRDTETPLD